jgi:hypothetical protein
MGSCYNQTMSDQEILLIADFLTREPIFHSLEIAQIRWLAERFTRTAYLPDQVIFSQGDQAKEFFIVFSGNARIAIEEKGEERDVRILSPGDFFGEEALINDEPENYSVKALENTELLHMMAEDFALFLNNYPHIQSRVSATAHSRRSADVRFDSWLQPDEVVNFMVRRHWIYLVYGMVLPVLVIIFSLAFLAFAFTIDIGWVKYVAGAFLFFGLAYGLWKALDWGNDYYIVTNKRVVALEKVIGLYDSRTEAPLTSVLSNDVTRSLLGQILNYGDVSVRTYMGMVIMRGADKPYELVHFIDSYKRLATRIDKQQELRNIEKTVREARRKGSQPLSWETIEAQPVAKAVPPMTSASKTALNIRTLTKMRFEVGEVVTYRRHWYNLIARTWWIILLMVLLTILTSWLAANGMPVAVGCSLGGIAEVLLIGTLGYNAWDWANDIFQLTKTQIIDIDKKPLGEEKKKTAALDAPDMRIEHVRPNLLANLLNFGNVMVYIGQTPFNLEGVFNPDQVHQEVAARREALLYQKSQASESRERERLLNYMAAFYQQIQEPPEGGDVSNPGRIL